MFRLYEKYCKDTGLPMYWTDGDDFDAAEGGVVIHSVDPTNENVGEDEF